MAKRPGLSPGSVIYTGKKRKDSPVTIDVFDYDGKALVETKVSRIEDVKDLLKKNTVTWVNISGVHDTELIMRMGEIFSIHPLVLEDIVNVDQRPKAEDFDRYLYAVLKMATYDEQNTEIGLEQISLILGNGFVVSFQEKEGDVFDPIRLRIRQAKGKIRQRGPDYLLYALLDAIVDNYYVALEKIGYTIEDLDIEVVEDPSTDTLQRIHKLKRELSTLRKAVLPLRELIHNLRRGGSGLIDDATEPYLRDVYDHCIQVIDNIETLRDTASSMLDVYLSSISNKMNDVMRVLTVIATIFIPLTFIAGMYGMNFDFMPELRIWWAYPLIWILVFAIAASMFMYFRRKGWL